MSSVHWIELLWKQSSFTYRNVAAKETRGIRDTFVEACPPCAIGNFYVKEQ